MRARWWWSAAARSRRPRRRRLSRPPTTLSCRRKWYATCAPDGQCLLCLDGGWSIVWIIDLSSFPCRRPGASRAKIATVAKPCSPARKGVVCWTLTSAATCKCACRHDGSCCAKLLLPWSRLDRPRRRKKKTKGSTSSAGSLVSAGVLRPPLLTVLCCLTESGVVRRVSLVSCGLCSCLLTLLHACAAPRHWTRRLARQPHL